MTAASTGVMDNFDSPRQYKTARISSYDKRGGNADGGQGNPLKPGQTRTIAEIDGPGKIAHIWVTMSGGGLDTLRDVILRMYWDGEKNPSVEVPIGEFFGLGHGKYYTYESAPFAIGNDGGLNCYWPMSFNKRAKVTIENVGAADLKAFYYYIDYQIPNTPPKDVLYFHAQYRQEQPVLSKDNFTILDATGSGHYAGCFFFVRQNESGWFGEGDDMIYIDGSKEPTLNGTGTEDYFCHAWGFAPQSSAMRFGVAFSENPFQEKGLYSVYRFHLEDAVTFTKSIKVTIEHGHANSQSDDFQSIAYWYQTEPHAEFPKLAAPFERRSSLEKQRELIKQKRFADLRKWQEDVKANALADYVKQTAEFNIAASYAYEEGTAKGVQRLLDYVGPFPPKELSDKATAVIKDLGSDVNLIPQSNVIASRDTGDGKLTVVTMEGSRCLKTDSVAGSPFIYFDVDNKILRNGNKPVLVEIEYYDDGTAGDSLRIEYDSAASQNDEDKYRPTENFVKPGKKGWNSAILFLDRARFYGRQNNGADFRIYCGKDKDEYIRNVKVVVKQN